MLTRAVVTNLDERQDVALADVSTVSQRILLAPTFGVSHSFDDSRQEPAPRMFWPKEIWGRFADSLDDFRVRPGE